jgi:hypothetical protein
MQALLLRQSINGHDALGRVPASKTSPLLSTLVNNLGQTAILAWPSELAKVPVLPERHLESFIYPKVGSIAPEVITVGVLQSQQIQ